VFALTCFAGLLWFPSATFALGVLALLVQLGLVGLTGWARWRCSPSREESVLGTVQSGAPPFVSVIVPICTEPVDLVEATLRAAANLDWARYEILVIDNNTQSEDTWRPVERACHALGARVRFFHLEKVPDAKAGALNFALQHVDPQSEYVLLVDADYRLAPEVIRLAVAAAQDGKPVDLVQFPQHYRNVSSANEALAMDFGLFFSTYQRAAQSLSCAACTGTLSFFRTSTLRSVGGFDGSVITEDAELGLRLLLLGFSIRYVHRVVGSGVLPLDVVSLKKQRWRWAFGNLQVLVRHFRRLVSCSNLDLGQKVGSLAHLSAWLNPLAVPAVLLAAAALVAAVNGQLDGAQRLAADLAGVTVVLYTLGTVCRLAQPLRAGSGLGTLFGAFLVHAGLAMTSALVPVHALAAMLCPPTFQRTNKSVRARTPDGAGVAPEILAGLAMFGTAVTLAIERVWIGALGALACAGGALCILTVHAQLAETRRNTAQAPEDGSSKLAQSAEQQVM
jgi:hypothetical protein